MWLRVCRPLLLWLIMFLALLGYVTHQRLMSETRLRLTTWLGNAEVSSGTRMTLDDLAFDSGDLVKLGRHTLAITHPKADPWKTNLFIWYHGKDLGKVTLNRSEGILSVSVTPPAALLTIKGPEFSGRYTNSSGMTSAVPTDQYVIDVHYAHWRQSVRDVVLSGSTTWRPFAPKLGTLRLEANQEAVTYELHGNDGGTLDSGVFPASVADLPAGSYRLVSTFGLDRR